MKKFDVSNLRYGLMSHKHGKFVMKYFCVNWVQNYMENFITSRAYTIGMLKRPTKKNWGNDIGISSYDAIWRMVAFSALLSKMHWPKLHEFYTKIVVFVLNISQSKTPKSAFELQ